MIPDFQLFIEFFEGCIVELLSIVWDEHLRNSKIADGNLLDEVSDILLSDIYQWLCFHPFSEIIDSHHQELHLPRPHRKWINNVKSPLGERPRGYHQGKILQWLSRYSTKVLTFVTSFDVNLGICLH